MAKHALDLPLSIRSTGDVSLAVLETAFDEIYWATQVCVDERQYFYKSFDAPSFVQLVAALPWWGQLGISAAGVVVSGYLKEAGSSIWKSQPAFGKFVSEKLWSLASRIVAFQPLISANTRIEIGFPLRDEYFPAVLTLTDLSVDSVAFQIAALCYHHSALEEFVSSPAFNPASAGRMELQHDGTIILNWQENDEFLSRRSHSFPI